MYSNSWSAVFKHKVTGTNCGSAAQHEPGLYSTRFKFYWRVTSSENGRLMTNPDILRLMVNCSQMSDASSVSWGPTKLSSCSQNSLVSSTEAGIKHKRRKLTTIWRQQRRKYNMVTFHDQTKHFIKMGRKKKGCGKWTTLTTDHKTGSSAHSL